MMTTRAHPGSRYETVRAALVQEAPAFLDREATTEKACAAIKEAGRNGADLVAFCEGFIPGHPLWYHFHPATGPTSRELALRLFENAVEIPGPTTDALGAAAAEAGAYVVMGMSERWPGTYGTLYNSQLFLGPDGAILGVHRKLTPTVGERLVHAGGGGATLRALSTPFGPVGGLICAESSNPLALFTLLAEQVVLLVISWPNLGGRTMPDPADRALVAGRAAAFASKAFVLNCCGSVDDEMRDLLAYTDEDRAFLADGRLTGGSSVVGPDGIVVAGPLGPEEAILYADLDLERCVEERLIHDFSGHYNRPDVFRLVVNDAAPQLFTRRQGAEPGEPGTTTSGGDVAPTVHRLGPTDEEA